MYACFYSISSNLCLMARELQGLLEESHQIIRLGLINFTINLLSPSEDLECWELLNVGAFGNFAQRIILNINFRKVNAFVLVLLGIPRDALDKLSRKQRDIRFEGNGNSLFYEGCNHSTVATPISIEINNHNIVLRQCLAVLLRTDVRIHVSCLLCSITLSDGSLTL